MSLDEFIECMGVVLYGKGRFFRQDDGTWYDRDKCDYASTAEVLERIYRQCSEEIGF